MIDFHNENIMLSGGAKGSDYFWAEQALKCGHQIIHWSYEGHKSYHSEHSYDLSLDELKEADDPLRKANISLKRFLPYKNFYVINLLRRNWFQIRYADSVYAVGVRNDKNSPHRISGGTAWACQMYIDKCIEDGSDAKLYFYDQDEQSLYCYILNQYSNQISLHNSFVKIDENIARPSGIYAAIGIRELNEHGRRFIKNIFVS